MKQCADIRSGKSKISGRGLFARVMLRPGIPFNDDPARKHGFNHSCQPNCIIVRNDKGGVWFVIPLRIILPGEELTLDYRNGHKPRKHGRWLMSRPPRDCRPCRCPSCMEKR